MSLRVEKLSKCYGDKWALRDVSFDVSDGEIFGIFGATGAGKSSILKVVSGIQKANGGTISVNGSDVDIRRSRNRSVHIHTESQASVWSALTGTSASEMSRGEQLIANFDQTIQRPEPILLFDEPFASVDEMNRDSMFRKMRRAAAEGKTIVFASSNFEQMASICDRLVVVVTGESVQDGWPQEVYENPVNLAVARAVGRNNLFTARRLSSSDAEIPEFQTMEGSHRLFAQHTEKRDLGSLNQNVTLAIRPEHVSIAFGASFPEDNLVKAVVREISYRGETTLVELDADGLILESRVFRIVGLNVGEECMLALPPHRIQVMKN